MKHIHTTGKGFDTPYAGILICFFLALITLAVYWQVASHEFISFDDNYYVTDNHYVQKGLTIESAVWSFSFENKDGTYWHPLTWLSHILDCHFFGLDAGMHHLTNVILHTGNSLLLFLAFRRMTGSLWPSAVVALYFALHPINVDSVAWVAERKNVLSTFFWMLTLFTYAFYADRRGFLRYLLTLFMFSLGLLAKPMLATLPFVLLLLDYWPLNRTKEFSLPSVLRLIGEKIPFLILSGVSIYVSMLSLKAYGNVIGTDIVPISLRISNALVSYTSYIGKMFWPVNLAVHHPYPHMVPNWQITCAALFLILVSVLILCVARKKPYLTVGWLWFLGTLVPVIGLVQAGLWPAMAERWAYVPLIGLFIIVAWGLFDLGAQWGVKRRGAMVIFSILFALITATTWHQLRHWKTSESLFSHTLQFTENNYFIHQHLAVAKKKKGKTSEAMAHYYEALRLYPNFVDAHLGVGYLLAVQGKTEDAFKHYNTALKIDPENEYAHYNKAVVLLNRGKHHEAVYHLSKALRINPHFKLAKDALATTQSAINNTRE